eukprot:TRINITY_DN275_c4_g1_i1.p1 TRINITY_DN275_c4_g1~~TRINITY_DN275_c4_g1_i1.p1  ORF type:complete len:130 (+),score=9.54 TRINITY_DN275_c4_g1_i1:43-432(+)
MSEPVDQKSLLIAALFIVVGCVLHILACTVIDDTFYPLLIMAMYLIAPLPLFLCAPSDSSFLEDNSGFETLGNFIIGMFGVSGPCLTFVLLHNSLINDGAAVVSFLGGFFVVGAVYIIKRKQSSDDMGF